MTALVATPGVSLPKATGEPAQDARAIVVIQAAKKGLLSEAETRLTEYAKNEPQVADDVAAHLNLLAGVDGGIIQANDGVGRVVFRLTEFRAGGGQAATGLLFANWQVGGEKPRRPQAHHAAVARFVGRQAGPSGGDGGLAFMGDLQAIQQVERRRFGRTLGGRRCRGAGLGARRDGEKAEEH